VLFHPAAKVQAPVGGVDVDRHLLPRRQRSCLLAQRRDQPLLRKRPRAKLEDQRTHLG
jgi:hypothetical protein